MKFHRIFGPSLCPSKSWYAVSLESSEGRIREYIKNETCKVFSSEFAEVSIDTLVDCYGQRVPNEWFGSTRKRSSVVGATAFGLLARSLRSKSLKSDKFIQCELFPKVISKINDISLKDEMAGNGIPAPAIIQDTPPRTPTSDISSSSTPLLSQKSSTEITRNLKHSLKTFDDINEISLGVRQRSKALGSIANSILKDLKAIFSDNSDAFGAILGNCFLYSGEEESIFVSGIISAAVRTVASKHGVNDAFRNLTGKLHEEFLNSITVPDWVQLYVKLACKIPDRSWQTLLNYLNIGKSGKTTDAALLLTNNSIRSHKQMVFSVTRQSFKMEILPTDLRGYGVGLPEILVWAIRESRLHNTAPEDMIFNLKLDGRPLAGKEQVSVGIVPIGITSNGGGNQSSLSVYPLAIANCSETRNDLKRLIARVNEEKKKIKENGIVVDGKLYRIHFKVTLDLKAFLKLIAKKNDENFELGGRGMDKEFCMFCDAIRACKEHMYGSFNEVCVSCLRSKANIGRGTGIRDDLTFLLEEDLSNIVLCSLHCEMRNTEQLIGSLGLSAYKCNSLEECNESLSRYGPENTRGYSRIKVELRKGQETAVTKSNIVVTSFSGSTERKILKNVEDIVNKSLPLSKVASYFREIEDAANSVVLGYVSFVTDQITYLNDILQGQTFTRDFGKREEVVSLDNNKDLKSFLQCAVQVMENHRKDIEDKYLVCCAKEKTDPPPRKRAKKGKININHERENALAELAATIHVNCIHKVFQGWSEIAMVMRDEVFEEEKEQTIDIFDVKCKLWGRQLRHIFGATLGTGDYGHLTVDHSSMLLRLHRSFAHYSNQGFEASHKVHRALYSRATSHDQGGEFQSIDQITAHWLSEMMLHLRFQFVKAKECIQEGKKNYYFRGCGWKSKPASWSEADIWWIFSIVKLFEKMYGEDSLRYDFVQHQGTKISDSCDPRKTFTYDHGEWEAHYEEMINGTMSSTKPLIPRRRRLYAGNPGETINNTSQSTYQTNTQTNLPTSSSNTAKSTSQEPGLTYNPTNLPTSSSNTAKSTSQVYTSSTSSPIVDKTRIALSSTLSRIEFAAIKIPPISVTSPSQHNIMPIFDDFHPTDPFSLLERPPETAIDCVERIFRQSSQGRTVKGVEVQLLGLFSRDGITVLRKYCEIAQIQTKIAEEKVWLDIQNDGINLAEVNGIKDLLWKNTLTATVLKAGLKSMDVSSFSTLVKERYLDNFVIDTTIIRYIKEFGSGDMLYLPSEVHTWLRSNDEQFVIDKLALVLNALGITGSKLNAIIMPLHMNGCHWGLVVIDLMSKIIYFDDGYKLDPQPALINKVKNLLTLIKCLIPNVDTLEDVHNYERFGMPYQGDLGLRGQGAGSCGMGVILSARDFIQKGIPATLNQFNWDFRRMRSYRKQLMAKIVLWTKE